MRYALITLAVAFVLSPAVAAAADSSVSAVAQIAPPARPTALTGEQYQALRTLETQPEHSKVLSVPASYSKRERNLMFTRASDDFWSIAYHVGWPGGYLAVLLCAL